jgi:hypothetical protein
MHQGAWYGFCVLLSIAIELVSMCVLERGFKLPLSSARLFLPPQRLLRAPSRCRSMPLTALPRCCGG